MNQAGAPLQLSSGAGSESTGMKWKFSCSRAQRGQVGQVEVLEAAHAPVEMDLALEAALEGVLDHALDRREAGGAGDEDDRPLGFAQREVADRALEADLVAFLHPSKTCVVKRPPGIRRICSSTNSASCGGLAKEKARRWPSSRMMLMYWPALKGSALLPAA
jgi:hypothetical protein